MLIQPGALSPVPSYAVVSEDAVRATLRELVGTQAIVQRLDIVFSQLEREQPALEAFLSSELEEIEEPSTQALGYFLFLSVFMAFRESFGARLSSIAENDLSLCLDRLLADSDVRRQTCGATSYSEDVIALGQPALMRLIRTEIESKASDGAAEPLLQALLVEVVALTAAVAPLS